MTAIAAILAIVLFAPAASAATNQYVALGDSYASGMGADAHKRGVNAGNADLNTYEPGTAVEGTGCWRNVNAYPYAVANNLGYDLTFRACAGATIDEVLNGKSGEPSQLDSLWPETELVTLTAGGNDVDFMGIMSCIITSYCQENGWVAQNTANKLANELPGRYDHLLAEIKSRAPSARIAMFGYAVTVPGPFNLEPYMQPSEQRIALNLRNNINQVMAEAAARNGVEFIDPFVAGSPFNRKDAHADNITSASATWALRLEVAGIGSSWHPTRKGHDYAAQVITAALS
ncbi:MAG: SGNH/GDSL hydrolase family protein [Candidatus Saccharimonadales bacterium]